MDLNSVKNAHLFQKKKTQQFTNSAMRSISEPTQLEISIIAFSSSSDVPNQNWLLYSYHETAKQKGVPILQYGAKKINRKSKWDSCFRPKLSETDSQKLIKFAFLR